MSDPLPHSTLSWKFPIWYTGIHVATLISEWEPVNICPYGGSQIENPLGISDLGAPPIPLYQIEHFQDRFRLVQKSSSNFVVGCPRLRGVLKNTK